MVGKNEKNHNVIKRFYLFGKIAGFILWISCIFNQFEFLAEYSYIFIKVIRYMIYIIGPASILYLIISVLRKKNLFLCVLNIFSFYSGMIFAYELFQIIRRIINYIKSLINFPKNIFLNLFILIFSIIGYICIFKSNNYYILYLSIFISIISTYMVCYLLFYWVISPFIFAKWIDYYGEKLRVFLDESIKEKKEELYKGNNFLKVVDFFERYIVDAICKNHIDNLCKKVNMKSALIMRFLLLIVITFVFSIVNFSLQYYALYKIDPSNIIGIGNEYLSFLFFSISNFISSNFKAITTNSKLAKYLIIAERYLSIYFLTVIIFVFTSIAESVAKVRIENAKKTISNIKNQLEDIRKECEDWKPNNKKEG